MAIFGISFIKSIGLILDRTGSAPRIGIAARVGSPAAIKHATVEVISSVANPAINAALVDNPSSTKIKQAVSSAPLYSAPAAPSNDIPVTTTYTSDTSEGALESQSQAAPSVLTRIYHGPEASTTGSPSTTTIVLSGARGMLTPTLRMWLTFLGVWAAATTLP